MSVVKQPYVVVNKLPASQPSGLDSQKLLVIGQKLAAGTAIEKTLITGVERGDISDMFGLSSILGVQLSSVFDEFDQAPSPNLPRVDVIALEDAGAAISATASIALSASGGDDTINKTGTLDLSIAGETISLSITTGDSITADIAPALEAAVNALDIPVTATDDGAGTVDLAFNNGGTIGTNTTVKIDGLATDGADYFWSNMQVDFTPFAGGATDPTLTDLLDVAENVRYQTMTYPYEYGTDLAVDFLDPRFNVANNILDGAAVLKATDSKADLLVIGDALNSENLVLYGNKEVTEDNFYGGEDLELDFVAAARVAAIRALRLTEDSNLANINPASANGSNDAFGGMHIASLPYFNTPVNGSPLQPEGRGWSNTDIEDLLDSGISTMGNNKAGNVVILGEMVSTYKTDAAGNTDTTWKFMNTVDTMSVCAEYIFNNLKVDFVQSRLTQGDIVRGYSIVNRGAYLATMQEYYIALANKALVPKSKEAVNYFISNLSVTVDTVLGRITASGDLPVVVQLREILVSLKTNFGSSLV